MKSSTLFILLLCLIIFPAIIWLLPVIYPAFFTWLNIGWQAGLTLLSILPFPILLAVRYWRRRKKSHVDPISQEQETRRQDALQRKNNLNADWQQIWKKLGQRLLGNPYEVP